MMIPSTRILITNIHVKCNPLVRVPFIGLYKEQLFKVSRKATYGGVFKYVKL